jgi:hypothetical protein
MPFDASYTPPQAPAGLLTMQEVQARQQALEEGKQRTALTLRSAVQDAQIGAQKIQENALDLQQKQIDMKDQATMRQAYMESGGDMAKYQQRAMQLGVSPKAMVGIQQQLLDIQDKHAKLNETQLKNEAATTQAMGSAANSLLALPDEASRVPQWAAARQQMITAGKAQAADVPVEYPGENWLMMHRNFAVSSEQAIENAFKDRTAKAAEESAAARKLTADTGAAKDARLAPGEVADANQKQAAALAPQLEAALKRGGPDAVAELLDQTPHGVAKRFTGASKPGDFLAAALTPDQAVTTAETAKRDATSERQGNQRIAIEGQNASINAKKFSMEFGGDAVKGWAKQVAENPDSANQVPAALRTPVSQAFTASTGLPFPKPLSGPAVDQERAAHNALKAVAQITDALQDPEIQSRRGAVLGRIGNAEQDIGATVGLSASAATKAAELRSNLRYLFTQELKANIGGRPPVELAKALESVSPNITLSDPLMQGSLNGVKDAALRTLDSTDEQRFGSGKTRSREDRGLAPAAAGADPNQNPFRKKK